MTSLNFIILLFIYKIVYKFHLLKLMVQHSISSNFSLLTLHMEKVFNMFFVNLLVDHLLKVLAYVTLNTSLRGW